MNNFRGDQSKYSLKGQTVRRSTYKRITSMGISNVVIVKDKSKPKLNNLNRAKTELKMNQEASILTRSLASSSITYEIPAGDYSPFQVSPFG